MFTSTECLERAEQKFGEAELQPRHERRLRTAAEGWMILADIMERLEATLRVEHKSKGDMAARSGARAATIPKACSCTQMRVWKALAKFDES